MRWTTVDDEQAGALFDADALAQRHVGRGEFAGMEFLHVNAKRIISEVPKTSRMSFRYTINAYRGCSHACSYCLAGDTPVLMADGRTRPISTLLRGDRIYGVERRGAYLRHVPTEVLDHWETVKPAYRIRLADGTEIVASGDHRFLTDRGWKHVTDAGGQRPHLTTTDQLVGASDKSDADLRVMAVEPLGVELPMYDITTGTGNFIANGVVSHNCFARPTHEYLGMGTGEDFERRIVVKVNAVERLRAEIKAKRWSGAHIAMGTNTDPYQRCEGKYHLTQGIVAVLAEAGNPFSILTKSTLILRDLDALAAAARCTDVRVNLSVSTLDEDVWRLTEPGTPPPRARIEAVRRLNEAGVPCGVLMAPIIPGLSDSDQQLGEVAVACVAAGATSITPVVLHLRPGVREHYLGWLQAHRPDLLAATTARYRRSYLPAAEQRAITDRARALIGAARPASRRWRTEPRIVSAETSAQASDDSPTDRIRRHMGGDRHPDDTVATAVEEQLSLGL